MEKYITVPDIRRYPCYKSTNCRLLYMHVAMGMDISTRNYAHSWRQLSAELDMPLQQLRTALKQLERDGLVATQQVTQKVTYGLTQQVTHKVTEIHILSINELDEATNEATNSPTNSQSNSQLNSPTNSDNNILKNSKKESLPLTDARVVWAKEASALSEVLKLDPSVAASMVEEFRKRQQLKQKAWLNEGDLLAHLIAWAEKRMPRPTKAAGGRSVTDHDARVQERQRTQEEEAAKSSAEKKAEEVQRLRRWIADGRRRKDSQYVATMEAALNELIAS